MDLKVGQKVKILKDYGGASITGFTGVVIDSNRTSRCCCIKINGWRNGHGEGDACWNIPRECGYLKLIAHPNDL